MEYKNAPKGGKIAINLDEGDELINVCLTDGDSDIYIATYLGKMIRFSEKDVRPLGRVSRGVRGVMLREGDYAVGMDVSHGDEKVLIISENGYGKKTETSEYKLQTRGGQGTTSYKISEETGNIAGFSLVTPEDDIILITSEGIIIRIDTEEISTLKRVTKGVRLMRLGSGVKIVSAARVAKEEDKDENAEDESESDVNSEVTTDAAASAETAADFETAAETANAEETTEAESADGTEGADDADE